MNEGGDEPQLQSTGVVSGGKGSNSAAQLCGCRIGKLQGWTGKLQQIGGDRGNVELFWKRGELYNRAHNTDMPYSTKWR